MTMADARALEGSFETASAKTSILGWLVFALTFGLLLSDYMSRQVLSAVYPMLKSEWNVSDGELGALSGVVGLAVGVLAAPLSYLADRVGRVRSLVAMAVIWSLATLACGLARNYGEMLLARAMVGVGEAAYGSVGAALVLSYFPIDRRATITAAFLAGATIGAVLGVSLGGVIAHAFSWRAAFMAMAAAGLALAAVYPLVVRTEPRHSAGEAPSMRALLSLVRSPAVVTYIAGGAQLFVSAALMAWLPTLLVRTYAMTPDIAAVAAGGFLLLSSIGSIACGMLGDRHAKGRPERLLLIAAAASMATFVLVASAFQVAAGWLQLLLLGLGMAVVGGAMGPASATVAALTDPRVGGSAFALIALGNNIFGIAPGPPMTGYLADAMGLAHALGAASWASLVASLLFVLARSLWISRPPQGAGEDAT